jgi:putative flippase GtrA
MNAIAAPLMPMLRHIYIRYIATSAGALGVDMALFMALLTGGIAPWLASSIGYSAGIIVHWLLSSRAVFTQARSSKGGERQRQKALFVASALVGLTLTTAIVGLGHALGLDARLAKIVAIAVSFQATYLLRKRIVFA